LLLKNNLKLQYAGLPEDFKTYIKVAKGCTRGTLPHAWLLQFACIGDVVKSMAA
jgi:hypothetical protein